MSTRRLLCLSLLLLFLPGLLTSCIGIQLGDKELEVGIQDKPLPESYWKKIGPQPEGGATVRFTVWPLPGIVKADVSGVTHNAKHAGAGSLRSYGIIPGLPFYSQFRIRTYTPEGDIRGLDYSWNLFFTGVTRLNGFIEGLDVGSSGIPLFWHRLYAKGKIMGHEVDFQEFDTLWTLGPSFNSINIGNRDNPQLRDYAVYPLRLAGLGGLLWLSMHQHVYPDLTALTDDDPGEEEVTSEAHGPLWGWLGYHSSDKREGKLNDQSLLLLGGILWRASSETSDGYIIHAANGPLWAMFGWGKKHGQNTVRFFWFDVPV